MKSNVWVKPGKDRRYFTGLDDDHGAITDRMPIGWHVAAVCYATAVFLLGWWPWNFLLLLLLFTIRNKRVRFFAFRTVAAKQSMRTESCRWGSPT